MQHEHERKQLRGDGVFQMRTTLVPRRSCLRLRAATLPAQLTPLWPGMLSAKS